MNIYYFGYLKEYRDVRRHEYELETEFANVIRGSIGGFLLLQYSSGVV